MGAFYTMFFFWFSSSFIYGQNISEKWYSVHESNGVTIQNSYPKGGPYKGPTTEHFNYSYLVFYSRIINETDNTMILNIDFSSESFPIPNSPDTYVKLFLPDETMTLDKQSSFSYGITELESLDHSTSYQNKLNPGDDCLYYVVAIFYQTKADAWQQERGGNRAEFMLKGNQLFFNMMPQVNAMPCGQVSFNK